MMIEPPVNRLANLTRQNSVRPLLTRHTPTPEGKPLIFAFFTSKSSHYQNGVGINPRKSEHIQ